MFPNIRIVLVETYHPGNIGSAACAEYLLSQAITSHNLAAAVKNCSLVIGASQLR